jgi:hypothetical protein
MEATCSSKTSIDFERTTLSFIPEDRTLGVGLLVGFYYNEGLQRIGMQNGRVDGNLVARTVLACVLRVWTILFSG